MKIGIITLNGIVNIGNRLQNYAVQELLKDRGHTVSTILYSQSDDSLSFIGNAKLAVFNLLSRFGILTSKPYLRFVEKNPRMLLFQHFNDRYMSLTKKYYLKTDNMKKYFRDFDYYCVGSDQIWNTAAVQNRDFFFMCFAPPEKTFSFAASMGTTYIPEKYRETYIKGFSHVGHISVRESDMQTLIKQLSDRESTLLLDPTLFCTKQKWLSIAVNPKKEMPKKYIATYFLGNTTKSQRDHIEKFAHDNQLGIVDITGEYADYIGPSEFIHVLANADFIFTDSFHGTAFSIIFEKNFMVFQRNNTFDMSSRITTILDTFRLSHRFFNTDNNNIDDAFFSLIHSIQTENPSHIPAIMTAEKEKLNVFLDRVFRSTPKGDCL